MADPQKTSFNFYCSMGMLYTQFQLATIECLLKPESRGPQFAHPSETANNTLVQMPKYLKCCRMNCDFSTFIKKVHSITQLWMD